LFPQPHLSRTAQIRQQAATRDGRAEALLQELLRDLFQLEITSLQINHDPYSLNSLNGFFATRDGEFFFKFHQEEGEEAMRGEYYRADILLKAGLPVDAPVKMSTLPGEQILIYRRRHDPRFSDVLRQLDLQDNAALHQQALQAEVKLNRHVFEVYRQTLHPVTPAQVMRQPIHRLFFERLIEPQSGLYPGGRLNRFYIDKIFAFPGLELHWHTLSQLHFCINGVHYQQNLQDLFHAAHARLHPERLADAGGVTAHGDAHNANVWFCAHGDTAQLSFFDPAFAGAHVPTLLAEIKATFHNSLAHPLWLYEPSVAGQKYTATARRQDDVLHVTTDWQLSAIRKDLLNIKAQHLWRPLLQELARRQMLPADWRKVLRLGLFLCPTLVMNLRAGAAGHNTTSSLIGFCMAIMAGSEPVAGQDVISQFLDAIAPDQEVPVPWR